MKRSTLVLLFASLVLALSAGACSRQPARKYPPYQSVMYTQQPDDGARQRAMIADMQLSKNRDSYYRIYTPQDPVVAEAVRQYDSGDAVMNIYQFDVVEIDLGDVVVVYGGTNTVVNGGDVVLASDIGGLTDVEARIRYMLADMQLGNVVDYYRQFTADPPVKEAVDRWDAGVRVVNIDRFERRILVQAGWKVLYAGTDNPINGRDVILTSDQGVPSANGQEVPPVSGGQAFDPKYPCANPYFPAVQGASWTYVLKSSSESRSYTRIFSFESDPSAVIKYGGAATYSERDETGELWTQESVDCNDPGWVKINITPILPPEDQLFDGNQVNGLAVSAATFVVPAGTFDGFRVCNAKGFCYGFAKGVGVVFKSTPFPDGRVARTYELTGYTLP